MRFYSILSVAALGSALWLGCSNSQPISGDPPPIVDGHDHDHSGHDHSGHDHGHSHAHLGPNGGHLMELGDEEYHLEWTHDDDSGKLTVFILDGNVKELVPIAAEKIVIEKSIGTRSDKYELTAVDRQGEVPKSAKFEIVDKALVTALKAVGDGVEASLSVDINGKPFTVPFVKHEDHHGHKH